MTMGDPFPGVNRSVLEEPISPWGSAGADVIIHIATVADDISPWGAYPATRDSQLRNFWPTEPIFASAMTSTAAKYASFGWTLEGPPRTVKAVQRMLHWVENGQGWQSLMTKVLIDLFSQDNGAFIEVVRTGAKSTDPVLTLNHLDSARCIRTGKHLEPVIYFDRYGKYHRLKWYQVICLAEMPSPVESVNGMQYCALTRMLRAAQILRDVSIYHREKIGGRFNRALILVGGVQKKSIDDVLANQREVADAQGLARYMQPAIIASLDPTATVSKQVIELASLPDSFDYDVFMRWYIIQIALAFETDSQEFAPLPAGNLGSSQQSAILHMKSRGKGPAMFMSMIEHAFNFWGITPDNVMFKYGNQDMEEDIAKVDLKIKRAQERAARITSGEITVQVAQQMAVDSGDLDIKYLESMGQQDITGQITVSAGDK